MKFIVVIVALQLALMGVITVVIERHQRAGILDQARLRALSLALSLAALSEGELFGYNLIKLEQTAEKVAADDPGRLVRYSASPRWESGGIQRPR